LKDDRCAVDAHGRGAIAMKPSRPFLVAGTIVSGVAAVAPGHSVYAQTSHGLVLAQAAPANPAEAKPTTNQDIQDNTKRGSASHQ